METAHEEGSGGHIAYIDNGEDVRIVVYGYHGQPASISSYGPNGDTEYAVRFQEAWNRAVIIANHWDQSGEFVTDLDASPPL